MKTTLILIFVTVVMFKDSREEMICDDGMKWVECSCQATCTEPVPQCDPDDCYPGCQCVGHHDVLYKGKCIHFRKCPVCPAICEKPYETPCDDSCPVPCDKPCHPKLPIRYNGLCSKFKNCMDCRKPMVPKRCQSTCTPTCDNPKPECADGCESRCVCPPRKPLLHNGKCLSPDQCPKGSSGHKPRKCSPPEGPALKGQARCFCQDCSKDGLCSADSGTTPCETANKKCRKGQCCCCPFQSYHFSCIGI